jgi:hypothetical protein
MPAPPPSYLFSWSSYHWSMLPTGRIFMEQTRYEHLTVSDQTQGLPAPPLEKAAPKDARTIPLPQPLDITVPSLDIRNAIEKRRSVRHYSRDPLTIEELAYLCWCTQGIVEVKAPFYTLRNVPSAGGRHALETYLLINRVKGIQPGLYRYLSFSHDLLAIDTTSGVSDTIMSACLGQAFVRSAAVSFIWSALIYRMAMEVQRTGVSARTPRCRACLPEPLPCRRADRLWHVCDRCI